MNTTMNLGFPKKEANFTYTATNKQFLTDCTPFSVSLSASLVCKCAKQRTLTHGTSQLEVGVLPKHTDIQIHFKINGLLSYCATSVKHVNIKI